MNNLTLNKNEIAKRLGVGYLVGRYVTLMWMVKAVKKGMLDGPTHDGRPKME